MNRLWVRLTLAFVAVTLVGVAVVALLADWSASNQFRQYLARQESLADSGVLADLAAFYRARGTWDGVGDVLANVSVNMQPGRGQGQGRGRPPLLFADANGRIVYDERNTRVGAPITADERANALRVTDGANTIGYLILTLQGRGALAPGDQAFLDQLRVALGVAALAAGSIGILLGLVISRTVAAPLANLARAARAFAARDWSRRVEVRGADEIAEVAREFNTMADDLQRAETLRRNLMADIAHELRTPLTVIQGNLSAMLDEVYPLDRAEIATLYDETRLLSRLVEDLRELSLAESGQLPLNVQAVDAGEIVRAAVANFSVAADSQDVRVNAEIADKLPHARADADRFAQVLRNLLSNALRHTPAGGVINVQSSVFNNQVKVSVRDTGEGIAAEDLPRVFDRFYRGDKSRARTSGGSGLGLAIAKTWVEAMGGAIGVESELGKGSCFWFSVPIEKTL
ncbi:two-component system, OmpR family, sensor histidine kinase BaeS [Anaerolineae bacterium]|nr:two-component system, OmpR family, sensor histidine kinase BaeS [Anaerolineae bacterium]